MQGDLDTTAVKTEFDEEFTGTTMEGTGEDTVTPLAPVSKGPKPKREKKEPGEDLLYGCLIWYMWEKLGRP